jgi:hypothetical protein
MTIAHFYRDAVNKKLFCIGNILHKAWSMYCPIEIIKEPYRVKNITRSRHERNY